MLITGFGLGVITTLGSLYLIGVLVERGQRKRAKVRRQVNIDRTTVHLDGVDVTRFLDITGRNGGQL